MRRKALAAVLMIVLLVLSVPVNALGAGADADVSGVVSDSNGPVASASVKVEFLAKGGLPKRTASLDTAADGTWDFTGKAGDYRFTFSADGYSSQVHTLRMEPKGIYALDVQLSPVAPPAGTIEGRITGSTGTGMNGFVYFYKQNADGTWPTAYLKQVATAADGTYSSGPLPLGTYKVRLFTVHTGVQWYRYAPTMDLATPVALTADGQVVLGIDAQFPPPAS